MVNTNKVPLRRIEGINNYKTNCITEIPQDIKLELADGVLTLKAGSKVYMPNGKNEDGSNKFDEIVVERDIHVSTSGSTATGKTLIHLRSDYNAYCNVLLDYCLSGPEEPTQSLTPQGWGMYYNSTTNLLKFYNNGWGDNNPQWLFSLPLGIVTLTSGTVTSIDQVFNGFGYIGNTIFALPGVKGLIPNGWNEDGSLNNIEYSQEDIWVYTLGGVSNTMYTFLGKDVDDYNPYFIQDSQPNEKGMWFDTLNNYIKRSTDNGKTWEIRKEFYIGSREVDYGKIISFNPKKIFKEVDQNDFPQLFEDNLKQKIKVVSDLPSNPEIGVLYYVKE